MEDQVTIGGFDAGVKRGSAAQGEAVERPGTQQPDAEGGEARSSTFVKEDIPVSLSKVSKNL